MTASFPARRTCTSPKGGGGYEGAAEEAADGHRHAGADHVRDDVVPDPLVRDRGPILVKVRNWTATAEGCGDLLTVDVKDR